MELDLEIKTPSNKTNIVEELKELNNTLSENTIQVYKGCDYREFTFENGDKIFEREKELIGECANENKIDGAEENKLYEIISKPNHGISVCEYNKTYNNREWMVIEKTKFPENVEKGMFFRKVGEDYVYDKETTNRIYNEMTSFENELIAEQKEMLNNMKIEGAIYKITKIKDDCEVSGTRLINQETGEEFQDLEFPHDIYHQIAEGSLVKYENGSYSVVEGTGLYDLHPNRIENYCTIDDIYITPNGIYGSEEELYAALDVKTKIKNFILKKVVRKIKRKLRFTVNKIVKLFKNDNSKM